MKTLETLSPHFKESFACLFLSHKYNKQNHKIKKHLVEMGTIQEAYKHMIESMQANKVEESLMNMHLLILLTQGAYNIKRDLEQQIDFDELIDSIKGMQLDQDDQLFVLRCLLELSSD